MPRFKIIPIQRRIKISAYRQFLLRALGLSSFFIFSFAKHSFGQKKLIEKFFSQKKDTSRDATFYPFPVLSSAPETGVEAGLIGLYSFYTDKNDTFARVSNLSATFTANTKKQTNFKSINDVWTSNNKYHFTNEIRLKNFPANFYGIGANTLKENKILLDQRRFLINFGVEKKVFGPFYTGIKVSYDQYRYKDNGVKTFLPPDTLYGHNGGENFSFGIQEVLDNRNNNTYTTNGSWLKIYYSYSPGWFGSDNYKGSFLTGDFSSFKTIAHNLVLGVNANFQSFLSSPVPFYLLPQLGNDQMMRGYYHGRYRDKSFLAAQSELRWRFNPRFAVVGFGGMGTVYGQENLQLDNFKYSWGGGFRYFFDIAKGFTLRLDYAIAEKVPGEKRQTGFYFSFGEAF